MEAKARIPVPLPGSNATTSYWQDPPDAIANLRTRDELPKYTDYIIIGSGISGAAITHNLQKAKPSSSILMLEARSTCSGATGRNGGHTKAASYRSFLEHEESYGIEEAVKIAKLEYATITLTHALAKELEIDCASNPCDTVDIIYDMATFERGKKAIERMQEVMGDDPAARYEVLGAEEVREMFHTPDAVGGFVYEAGSLSAYAFTVGLVKRCLEQGLNLQTNTPVVGIEKVDNFDPKTPRWKVKTPRGDVETANVVVATNGYTAHLLPRMQGLIVPLRGQVTAQRPGSKLPGLDTTYSFIYKEGYEYMITRPPGTLDANTIIIGGGLGTLPHQGASEYGNTNDAGLNDEISTYLFDCTERYFGHNWGDDGEKGRLVKEWSGVMGATADGLPYVGAVPDMAGVFVCAGFNGHGMVMCLKCAEMVVGLMVGGERAERVEEWFPKALVVSEERFGRKFEGRLDMRVPGEALFEKSQ